MRSNNSKPLLFFGIGMVAGWLAKRWFDSPELAEQRQKIMANVEEVKTRLAESDQAQRIKEVFGQVTDEATRMYEQSREQLAQELAALQVSLEDIDKQKYVAIVNGIVREIRNTNEISEEQVNRLTKALSSDFSKLKQRRARLKRRAEITETMTE